MFCPVEEEGGIPEEDDIPQPGRAFIPAVNAGSDSYHRMSNLLHTEEGTAGLGFSFYQKLGNFVNPSSSGGACDSDVSFD